MKGGTSLSTFVLKPFHLFQPLLVVTAQAIRWLSKFYYSIKYFRFGMFFLLVTVCMSFVRKSPGLP